MNYSEMEAPKTEFTPQSYPKKGLLQVYFNALKKSFIIKGRASRYDYWGFYFINLIIALLVIIFAYYAQSDGPLNAESNLGLLAATGILGLCYTVYSIIIIPATITIFIRRLHDIDKSGWQIILLPLKMVLTLLFLLIVFFVIGLILQTSRGGAETVNLIMSIKTLAFIVLGFGMIGIATVPMLVFFIWQCKKGNVKANKYGSPVIEDPKYNRKATIFIVLFFIIGSIMFTLGTIGAYNERQEQGKAGTVSGYKKAQDKFDAAKKTEQKHKQIGISMQPQKEE